ncbi:MAG: cytochrome b6-f complex iron-sulfur subunit [Actinomycetota bacterium]
MIIGIAIAVIAVMAVVFVVTNLARRDRGDAVGELNRETVQRDRSSQALVTMEGEAPTGREVERQAALEWRGEEELAPRETAPPALRAPLDPEVVDVTRRQFLNRGVTTLFGVGLAGFGGSMLAFLWPNVSGGFGSKIRAGSVSDVLGQIADTKEPFYVPEGRFYVVPYPKDDVSKAKAVYTGGVLTGMEQGLTALYQKCVHLGCRVPWCKSSQWFECPCHGSKYNRVGEKTGGPAPRGLDRFPVAVEGGQIVVDTGLLSIGPPIGTNTTGQQAEGPFCA